MRTILVVEDEMVEAHGGRIQAESGTGRGTVMRFVLPASGSDA
jgi:signal transduction histidine kinase